MLRRKSDANRGITVEEAAQRERPIWNDTLRGILVALVKDRRPLWDARFQRFQRFQRERTIQLFREIAAILSNQDSRMNEWYVLEKWCWMMEMYTRAVERPHFDWRFRGAMAFHMESLSNGVIYIDSLTPDLLSEATARYAETEAEVLEAKIELSPQYRKGCGAFRVEMAVCSSSPVCASESGSNRQKLAMKRSSSRSALETVLDCEVKGANLEDDDLFKEVKVKQEDPENDDLCLTGPAEIPASAATEPTLAFLLSNNVNKGMDENAKELPHAEISDVNWTSNLVCELIDSFKQQPALWHYAHPHHNDVHKRKELLYGIAKKLRKIPGGSAVNEDVLVDKWRALYERFNDELVKTRKGESSNWEFYQRMVFLSPEVLSACRFDDLNGGTQQPVVMSSVAKAVDANIRKILGYVPKSVHEEMDTPQVKKPKVAPKTSTPKPAAHWDTSSHVQQVVSTWVPPREDSVEAVTQPFSSAPPTATAQITSFGQKSAQKYKKSGETALQKTSSPATAEIGHILRSEADTLRLSSPRPCINGSKYGDYVSDHSLRVHEDKWTLMGRMIEETARELEAKNSELAYRLQKDINDVIFKYQIESLKHRQ